MQALCPLQRTTRNSLWLKYQGTESSRHPTHKTKWTETGEGGESRQETLQMESSGLCLYIYMLPGLVDLKNTKIQASFFSGDETMAQGTVGQAGTVYPSELPYTIR